MTDEARAVFAAQVTAETGLTEAVLHDLVHGFYARVRDDALLGPIFAAHISDWGPHLAKMVAFWSSVALMSGRYHGSPMQAHMGLAVKQMHFDRWLMLFRQTAAELCTPAGAAHVTARAERIARSLMMGIEDNQPRDVPKLGAHGGI